MKHSVVLLSFVMLLTAWLGSGCVVTAPGPPPPPPQPIVETYGVAPYPGAVWVSGSWGWHARERHYRWHRGYWR
jgi:hypothetical protein